MGSRFVWLFVGVCLCFKYFLNKEMWRCLVVMIASSTHVFLVTTMHANYSKQGVVDVARFFGLFC
jgi:putative effector of murein hydrolase LrgA (UPF0299 family)